MARTSRLRAKYLRKERASVEVANHIFANPLLPVIGLDLVPDNVSELSSAITQLRISNDESLVAQLPTEILCQIFHQLCLVSLPTPDPNHTSNLNLAQTLHHSRFAITSTCHRWRSIALCDPYLWRYITVHYPAHNYPIGHTEDPELPRPIPPIEATSRIVGLARNVPLILKIKLEEPRDLLGTGELYDWDIVHALNCTRSVLSNCLALHLSIVVDGVNLPLDTLFPDSSSDMPLRFLRLELVGHSIFTKAPQTLNLGRLPALEDFRLQNSTLDACSIELLPADVNRISRLQLCGNIIPESVYNSLLSCTRLKAFEWVSFFQESASVLLSNNLPALPRISLPKLTHLKLGGAGEHVIELFTNQLSISNLEHLYWECDHGTFGRWTQSYPPLSNLRSLHTAIRPPHHGRQVPSIAPFIEAHPLLDELSIAFSNVDGPLLILDKVSDHPTLLDLRNLWLDVSYWGTREVEWLLHIMVRKQRDQPPGIPAHFHLGLASLPQQIAQDPRRRLSNELGELVLSDDRNPITSFWDEDDFF